MIDERELREMLERRAGTISATPTDAPKAIRRARRRLALNATMGMLVGLAVLAGAFAGLRAIQAAPTPADQPTPRPIPATLGSLAYGLDGDIYVAEWDGSNPVRIADGRPPTDCHGIGEYIAEGSIWSPDGRYLAYRHTDCDAAREESSWDVVISDAEGNVVTSFPSEGWRISWSPDSTRVAVWVRTWETIGVYGVDGVRQALLTMPGGGGFQPGMFDPVWLPDGASLLVRSDVVPLDGSTPRKLPWAGEHGGETWYSPDGSRVAYTIQTPLEGLVLHFGERPGGSFVIAAADGSHAAEVFGARVRKTVWSPTGDRIAFTSGTSTELRVVDVATGTVTSLAEKDGSGILSVLDFSPDGDRILFSRTEDQSTGPSSLWSIHADGSHLRRLVTGAAWGDWLA
jgi:dipeptidyl aminopeptidase/acylaminoacyl peptidase